MVNGIGLATNNPVGAIQKSYEEDITDEFLKPIICTQDGMQVAKIEANDVVFCFNFQNR